LYLCSLTNCNVPAALKSDDQSSVVTIRRESRGAILGESRGALGRDSRGARFGLEAGDQSGVAGSKEEGRRLLGTLLLTLLLRINMARQDASDASALGTLRLDYQTVKKV
jgi:hypothetical protein